MYTMFTNNRCTVKYNTLFSYTHHSVGYMFTNDGIGYKIINKVNRKVTFKNLSNGKITVIDVR